MSKLGACQRPPPRDAIPRPLRSPAAFRNDEPPLVRIALWPEYLLALGGYPRGLFETDPSERFVAELPSKVMGTYFEKPPLVELIVEVRWFPSGSRPMPGDPNQMEISAPFFVDQQESLFMNFAGLVGAKGFVQSERLLPPGFMTVPFQPVYRYSEKGAQPGRALYQLGHGVFSVHITPPYKRWNDFRPFVETGIELLVQARHETEASAQFTSTLVRYLDCFTDAHTGGLTASQFVKKKLRIDIAFPTAITSRIAPGKEVSTALQLSVPVADGQSMSVSLQAGRIGHHVGLIMDSSVASTHPLPPVAADVMNFLDEAHTVVSGFFVELTEPLHSVLESRSE
jgi:uncharacterized protein (TIGR04255 family)